MIYWHFLNKYKNIKKRQQQQKKQTCCNFIANTSKSFLKNTAKQKKQLLLRHMLLSLVVETLLGLYKIVQNLWNHTRNEIRLQSYTWIHNAKKYLHIRSYKSTHYVFVFPVAKHPCTKMKIFQPSGCHLFLSCSQGRIPGAKPPLDGLSFEDEHQ